MIFLVFQPLFEVGPVGSEMYSLSLSLSLSFFFLLLLPSLSLHFNLIIFHTHPYIGNDFTSMKRGSCGVQLRARFPSQNRIGNESRAGMDAERKRMRDILCICDNVFKSNFSLARQRTNIRIHTHTHILTRRAESE